MLRQSLSMAAGTLQRSFGLSGVRTISTTTSRLSDAVFVHRDSADNNPNTPFEFTKEDQFFDLFNL